MEAQYPVRGYYHPENSFATIKEWQEVANKFLSLQRAGYDTRGGKIDDNPELVSLITRWFSYQLYVETQQYDGLTQKEVLDFIEDFVNHRVWGLKQEFGKYLHHPNNNDTFIDSVKIAFFYSRGALEPYVLLNDTFTENVYGSTDITVNTLHWTTKQGFKNIADSLLSKHPYSISTFTKQWKPFFRPESNYLVKLKGYLVAAFKSDVKSIVTDKGNRAANMFRLAYPGKGDNLCYGNEPIDEDGTYLWNEVIIKPFKVLEYKKIYKY
jgi:hypothetical protein